MQVPERNFFLMAVSDAERNEWVAAIGRATTESRRVRSYSEEVEWEEEQARLAKLKKQQPQQDQDEDDLSAPARTAGTRFV